MPSKPGDRITTKNYEIDYPLKIVAVAGGRIAIGSSRWPTGATQFIALSELTSVNGESVNFPSEKTKSRKK